MLNIPPPVWILSRVAAAGGHNVVFATFRCLCFAGLAILLFPPVRAEEGTVALKNPGFEEGMGNDRLPSFWIGAVGQPHAYFIAEVDPVRASEGEFAVLCSSDPSHGAISQWTGLDLAPGKTYTLSAELMSRVAPGVEPGGFWLRVLARNRANPAQAYVLKNVVGGPEMLSAGEWVTQQIQWTAPPDLHAVPIISDGMSGQKPDGVADLSGAIFGLEVLVGGNYPHRIKNADFPFQQTWIDDVEISTSSSPPPLSLP